jgi:hypothetical protein
MLQCLTSPSELQTYMIILDPFADVGEDDKGAQPTGYIRKYKIQSDRENLNHHIQAISTTIYE